MPTRPFSGVIIGGLWPSTSPDVWWDVGEGLGRKADSLENNALEIRQLANAVVQENSGQTIDAMHEMCLRQAAGVTKQEGIYRSMSRAVEEIGRLIYGARTKLDDIDEQANAEIERIRQEAAAHAHGIGASVFSYEEAMRRINEVIAKARAAATAESNAAATKIATTAAPMSGDHAMRSPVGGSTTPPQADPESQKHFRGVRGPGPGVHGLVHNLPQTHGTGGTGDNTGAGTHQVPGSRFGGQEPTPANGDDEPVGTGTPPGTDPTKGDPAGVGDPKHPLPGSRFGSFEPNDGSTTGNRLPPPVSPGFTSPLGTGGPSSGGVPFSPARGLSSSLPSPSSLSSGSVPPLSLNPWISDFVPSRG